MNDGIMYTWDVKVAGSHGYGTLFTCARKEAAEYLRDWCEADEYNRYLKSVTTLEEKGFRSQFITRLSERLDRFSISESEVIL